jgi:hypothetical protein
MRQTGIIFHHEKNIGKNTDTKKQSAFPHPGVSLDCHPSIEDKWSEK